MEIHKSITIERVAKAIVADENLGICIACGEDAFQIEPDAREYTCQCCGEKKVYGAEELLLYLS